MQLLHLDMSVIFQSTPSAWRETHAIVRVDAPNYISIHSLRMEGDCRSPIAALRILHFNPLPPYGGRHIYQKHDRKLPLFQSTPSAWRETSSGFLSGSSSAFQSTPSAWRETQERQQLIISTLFQSTPSAWRETEPEEEPEEEPDISIHSLRMEGDGNALPQIISAILFQSTPSAWRETQGERHSGQCGHISIHSLRMEGDITSSLSLLLDRDFNPLPPHGGRPCRRTGSHSPLYHFNPLPPHGGRQRLRHLFQVIEVFQSTPSAWRETRRTDQNGPP